MSALLRFLGFMLVTGGLGLGIVPWFVLGVPTDAENWLSCAFIMWIAVGMVVGGGMAWKAGSAHDPRR